MVGVPVESLVIAGDVGHYSRAQMTACSVCPARAIAPILSGRPDAAAAAANTRAGPDPAMATAFAVTAVSTGE